MDTLLMGIGIVAWVAMAFVIARAIGKVSRRHPPAPRPRAPRLPHHRNNVRPIRPLPEWQEHERDVDHLERISKTARDEAFWIENKRR